MINKILINMLQYNANDPKRIQHLVKVHAFAKLIANMENIDSKLTNTIEIAALVHDIGIKNAEIKYGNCNGKNQEIEGPSEACKLLNKLGVEEAVIERVCFLVGHHHTYNKIDGIDYQILVEADFLVNIYEDNMGQDQIEKIKDNIFRTKSGIELLDYMRGCD